MEDDIELFSPITTYDTEIASSTIFYSTFFSQASYTFIFYGAILRFYNTFIYASLAMVHPLPFSFLHAVKLFTTAALETKIQTESCFY